MESIEIPSSISYLRGYIFSGCTSLKSVKLNEGTTIIGRYAFESCSSLEEITLPSTVKIIANEGVTENGAFKNCTALKTVVLNNGLELIGTYTFEGCTNLNSITIPKSVTTICQGAFIKCSSLSSVFIPNNVNSIHEEAFRDCSGLETITVESGNGVYDSRENCNAIIETATNKLIAGSNNTIIPNGVTAIGTYSFSIRNKLKTLNIPNTVTSIGSAAFWGCSDLSSVVIPESVTSIEGSAFNSCEGLTSLTIGKGITNIKSGTFGNCTSLTSVTINSNAIASKSYSTSSTLANTFGSQVTNYEFGDDVKSIGAYACYNLSSLSSVVVGENVTSIGASAFSDCSNLTSVTINSDAIASKTYNSSNGFVNVFGSQVKNYVFGDEVKCIGAYACYKLSGLTNVSIGNNVTSIGSYAFQKCSGITSIAIPDSMTSIGNSAFSGCTGLTKAEFASIENLCAINFGGPEANPLYYAHHLYVGEKEVTDLVIPNNVPSINNYAFYGCTYLTSITIPESVTSIGNSAFSGCIGLTSVTIPESVTSIGNSAFSGCNGLTSVAIPNSVISIGDNAFSECSSLTSLTIPSSVETISEYAFEGCNGVNALEVGATKVASNLFGLTPANIKDVSILDGVKEIEADAFKDCTNLERCSFESAEGLLKIKFGNGYANPLCQNKVLNIGDKIVTELAIPESITEVKDYALFNCKSLKSVTEGANVKTIGVSAFSGNTKLNKVVLGSKVEKIGNYAFKQCPLTSIYSYAEVPPTCGNNVFSMNAEECKLYVPSASVSRYQNHQDWYEFDIQPMISTFKLTYMVDGEVYKTFTVDSGSTITAEPNPYKEGYTFSGWSELPETMPENDVVVTGTFTVNNYTLTYKVDGEVYKTTSVPYGTELTPENAPTKEGHTFSGWSEIPETMPANDVEITGTFTVNTYKVTFMYGDEVLKTIEVEYGAEIPLPESLDSERYTLVEWLDVPETMPAQDIIIRADFTDCIESIRNAQMHNEGIHDLSGRKLSRMQKGINVIRNANGTTKRVLVK